MKGKKILFISLFILSAAAFFAAAVTDSLLLFVPGIPFFFNLAVLIHELGHGFGCLLNGNRITEINIPIARISGQGLRINLRPELKSYCGFIPGGRNVTVFLCGPLFSLGLTAGLTLLYAARGGRVLFLCAIGTAIHFLKNMIPLKDSDAGRILSELRKNKGA